MADEKLVMETWPVDRLIPYARNPRRNDEQVDRMAGAIREFGFCVPVVAMSNGTIVDGHLRFKAAKKLGIKEIPVVLADNLTEAQIKAFRILANQSVSWAEWDDDLLKIELKDLKDLDFDLEMTGLEPASIESLLAPEKNQGLTDPDDVPDAPDEPISKFGDVWTLGNHRLMCGDSTKAEDVERLLAGVKPGLMVTDPPYGVNYDPDWRNRADRANGKPDGGRAIGQLLNDNNSDWSAAYSLFPGVAAYVWHPAGSLQMVFYNSLVASGFEIRMQIIWAKTRFVIGRGHYHMQHEPCWYAVKKGNSAGWQGSRKESTLWTIEHRKSETGHGTQKPVECMRRPIENNSSPGQAIYEPFSGSGTTIIASEMTGRCCYAMELSPAYVDVAVKRWEEFTGNKAILEGADGTSSN